MLDTSTKKRIDDCRDILVGKLPDPKAQIEQITIGLIYKFMDDMDKEAIELGGKSKFFSNYTIPDPKDPSKTIDVEFEKYRWDNLFDPKVTAAEMLALYDQAITGMDKNPNIPLLFRNIFKNAFLPYKSPETLKLFLKTIGEFEYTHSEKLGDAFEYLLSVMGSQGDAGQFRTPRHIIDFLVAVVDPSKSDTILDPACGTAGFLISAFKHIKEKNNNKLTPEERKRLIQNVVGYDISPDMVRLSLVNLYLHGFSDPHIWEYDTLSSEDRWNETYDVILANPPFMSPKGGIRPLQKFSIKSTRSEVLFVDYIAEHLNPKGRAGIIVPEGVIFQSGTAYKELRKMLVEKYLYAVVSLPAGVFNPYSGVKTSILLMDREHAKKSDEILFVKIDNDGFGLGAQRNAIKGGQLSDAIEILKKFKNETFSECEIAYSVTKIEIANNGDYNLSGEKYKTKKLHVSSFPIVKLGNVTTFTQGTQIPVEKQFDENKDGFCRFIRIVDYTQETNDIRYIEKSKNYPIAKIDDLVMVRYGASAGFIGKGIEGVFANNLFRIDYDKEKILSSFLYYIFKSNYFQNFVSKNVMQAAMPALSHSIMRGFELPLPPLSVQQEIVSEIEGYQKIIDGAKMVVENYKPKIEVDPKWETVKLDSVVFFQEGPGILAKDFQDSGVPLLRLAGLGGKYATLEKCNFVSEELANSKWNHFKLEKGDIVVSTSASFGRPSLIDEKTEGAIFYTGIIRFRSKSPKLLTNYLELYLGSPEFLEQGEKFATGSSIKHFGPIHLKQMYIQLPPIEMQKQLVRLIEKEKELVNANKQLIEIFEQKIKERIARVWGDSTVDFPKNEYKVSDDRLQIAAEP